MGWMNGMGFVHGSSAAWGWYVGLIHRFEPTLWPTPVLLDPVTCQPIPSYQPDPEYLDLATCWHDLETEPCYPSCRNPHGSRNVAAEKWQLMLPPLPPPPNFWTLGKPCWVDDGSTGKTQGLMESDSVVQAVPMICCVI